MKKNKFKHGRIIISKAKNGEYTAKIATEDQTNISIHSNYNPSKEAKRFISSYEIKNSKNIIVIGFGLGYHVENLLNLINKQQKIYLIVLNNDLFDLAIKYRRLKKLFVDNRIEIVKIKEKQDVKDKLYSILNNLKGKNILIKHKPSVRAIPQRLLVIKDILEEITLTNNNQKRYGDEIKYNIKKNLELINKVISINDFKNMFLNKPFFIVSAGPSLDKNIDELKKIDDKGIIISVDTALIKLLNNNISPDFVISIDPIISLQNKFYDIIRKMNIPLIYTLGTSWKAINKYNGPKILGLSASDLLMDKLNNIINFGRIETSGSVANAALDFANICGGNPLILVGQDFALTNSGQTHAKDTFKDEKKKNKSLLRKIEGINDKEVFTTKGYYLLLKRFEKYISKHPSKLFIDATEGGAKIKGTRIMKLSETINNYCIKNINKNNIISKTIFNNKAYDYSIPKLKEVVKQQLK